MKRGLVGLLLAVFILSILYSQFVFSEPEEVTLETTRIGSHEHSKFLIKRIEGYANKLSREFECVDFVPKNSFIYATCDDEVGEHTHQLYYNGKWYTSSSAGKHNHEQFYEESVSTRVTGGGGEGIVGSDCADELHAGDNNYGTCDSDKHVHSFLIAGKVYYTDPAPLYSHSKFYTLSENENCIFGVTVGQNTYGSCDKKGGHSHKIILPVPVKVQKQPEEVKEEPKDVVSGGIVAEEKEPEIEEEVVSPKVNTRTISELIVIFVLGIVIGALVFMRKKRAE